VDRDGSAEGAAGPTQSGDTFGLPLSGAFGFLLISRVNKMRDPHAVAAIVRALRCVHGDDTARAMLTNGTTLAAMIDALLQSPLTNRAVVKLLTRALHPTTSSSLRTSARPGTSSMSMTAQNH
jgi:hypothetical protein